MVYNIDTKESEEIKMKKELTSKIYCKVFDTKENHENVNKLVKAVIVNFGDSRGDIVVKNDNFGTCRMYADFTNGKKEAGLHPLQIVFSGIENAKMFHEKYINENDEICNF